MFQHKERDRLWSGPRLFRQSGRQAHHGPGGVAVRGRARQEEEGRISGQPEPLLKPVSLSESIKKFACFTVNFKNKENLSKISTITFNYYERRRRDQEDDQVQRQEDHPHRQEVGQGQGQTKSSEDGVRLEDQEEFPPLTEGGPSGQGQPTTSEETSGAPGQEGRPQQEVTEDHEGVTKDDLDRDLFDMTLPMLSKSTLSNIYEEERKKTDKIIQFILLWTRLNPLKKKK